MSGDEPDTVILTYREDGTIDRRRLSGILGAATTLLFLLLIIALTLGAVGTMGIGIGGFVVEFSDVTAPSGSVYPAVGQQSACEHAPQLTATLDGRAEIQGYFRVTKAIPIPGSVIEGVSVDVMSEASNNSSITAQDLDLRLTALSARNLVLGAEGAPKSTIAEFGPSNYSSADFDPNSTDSYTEARDGSSPGMSEVNVEFGVNASGGFGIRTGRALVYQIAFNNIRIGSIGVSGEIHDGENMTIMGAYDCDDLRPPASDSEGNFTLPAQSDVDWDAPPNTTAPENLSDEKDSDGTTETDSGPEAEAAEIQVTDVTPPQSADVEIGDSIVVEANVTNTAETAARWSVRMRAQNATGANVTLDETELTLSPNETASVAFEHEATRADVPSFDATLAVEAN